MSSLNFSSVDHPFEYIVGAVKEAAKAEKKHSGTPLNQCLDLVAKHTGLQNWGQLMKHLDAVGPYDSSDGLSYAERRSRIETLEKQIRMSVFKALPYGSYRFAEKDAMNLISDDFHKAGPGNQNDNERVVTSLKEILTGIYPSDALDKAVEHALSRGPWKEDEINIDFYTGSYD